MLTPPLLQTAKAPRPQNPLRDRPELSTLKDMMVSHSVQSQHTTTHQHIESNSCDPSEVCECVCWTPA
eukprot:4895388-Prorocentrum_lima.AAC.1